MWPEQALEPRQPELVLNAPLVNAPGTLGFAPSNRSMPFLKKMGAFITNPISQRPRQPAKDRCCLPYQGGFLLHTGLPNPGISRVIHRFQRRWAEAPLPIIPHLLAEDPSSLADMVRKMEALENIGAVEIGLPPACTPEALSTFFKAAAGELPVIISLAPEQIGLLIESLLAQPPVAVHLTHPRGMLPGQNGTLISGRLYGPSVYPLNLSGAQQLLSAGLPVIASGGINNVKSIATLQSMGVLAVGMSTALWGVRSEQVFTD